MKGQLKIQQMAIMLLAVTLLFVLVGMLFLMFSLSSVNDAAEALKEKNSLILTTRLANSPEFSCGKSFGIERTSCIDFDKVMMLKEQASKYEEFWEGVSNIEIRKIYPENPVLCNIGNYPDCGIIRIFSSEIKRTSVSNFVSLCRKAVVDGEIYDKCELARVVIEYA